MSSFELNLVSIFWKKIKKTDFRKLRYMVQLEIAFISSKYLKYQGVKEFHMLARIGCCNFMVFSPFKVNVTYYHPLNQWLLGATNGNHGQKVMHHQYSETINHL